MGFFDWITRGVPNEANLAWLREAPYHARLVGTDGWAPRPRGRVGDLNLIWYSWSSGSGKNRTTYYRTFVVAPLPYSYGSILVQPRGCNLFSSSGPHDFEGFAVQMHGEFSELLGDLRQVATNLRGGTIEVGLHGFFMQANRFLVQREELEPFLKNAQWLYPRVRDAKEADHRRLNDDLNRRRLPGNARVAQRQPWQPPALALDTAAGPALIELETKYAPRVHRLPPDEHQRWSFGGGTLFSAPVQSPATLKVFPQSFWHALPKLFGYQDVSVGEPAFDDAYVVKSSDERWAQKLFSRDLARTILQQRVNVDLTMSRLMLRRDDSLWEPDALQSFAEGCLAILERLAAVTGMKVGVKVESVETAAGICQVCGAPIEKPVVCSRCRTPHHQDCWDYVGGCSTFACGEKQCDAA